jgi:hypothetical protein
MLYASENIILWRHGNRKGRPVPKEVYLIVADFIIHSLSTAASRQLSLIEVLDKAASAFFTKEMNIDLWNITQIKQDLVERGLIEVSRDSRDRAQYLKLKKRIKKVKLYLNTL